MPWVSVSALSLSEFAAGGIMKALTNKDLPENSRYIPELISPVLILLKENAKYAKI